MTTQLTNRTAKVISSDRINKGQMCFTSIRFTDVNNVVAYLWTDEQVCGTIEMVDVTENPYIFSDGHLRKAREFFFTIINHGRGKTNIISDLKLIEHYRSLVPKNWIVC